MIFGNSISLGTNCIDIELTHSRVFFAVKRSPTNSWPKWAPHVAHSISVLLPSGSGTRSTEPAKVSSNAGQPQPASNLLLDENSGALHLLQINVPSSKKLSYSPMKGASVPLCTMTFSSSGVSLL